MEDIEHKVRTCRTAVSPIHPLSILGYGSIVVALVEVVVVACDAELVVEVVVGEVVVVV